MHKFNPHDAARLNSPERGRNLPPEKILTDGGLAPGEVVVDIGCGPGYFALPAAAIVGEGGVVYALDISSTMLEKLREGVPPEMDNIQALLSEEKVLPLPDRLADFVLMANVLHEAEDTCAILDEVQRILRPNGRFLVVEWKKTGGPTTAGPPDQERMDQKEAVALALPRGFCLQNQWEPGPFHYCLLFGLA